MCEAGGPVAHKDPWAGNKDGHATGRLRLARHFKLAQESNLMDIAAAHPSQKTRRLQMKGNRARREVQGFEIERQAFAHGPPSVETCSLSSETTETTARAANGSRGLVSMGG